MIQTKTNFVLVLFILLLGSSSFICSAQGDVFFSPQLISQTSVPEKKDLSIFLQRLGVRFSEVFGEFVSLVQKSPSSSPVQTGTHAEIALQDIQWHEAESAITHLAVLGVINNQAQKFYPDNYLRRYELIQMLVKYRLVQQGNQLPQIVFSTRGWFADVPQNAPYAPYVAYAQEQGFLSGFVIIQDQKKYLFPNSFVDTDDVCALLELACPVTLSEKKITRGMFVRLLVDRDDSVISWSSVVQSPQSNELFQKLKMVFALAK